MATRIYLMPMLEVGNGRAPKYMASPINQTGLAVRWSGMDFGYEPLALVAADVTPAQHTALAANADVLAVPVDLQSSPGVGAVTTIQTYLESYNVPADWVNTTLTYAQILKRASVMFQLAQRLHGILGNVRLFGGAVTLSSTLASLPASARQSLLDAAASFGWDTSSLAGASTVREALKFAIGAWGIKPVQLMDVVL